MSGAVLDASALLAVMLNEPGADVVEVHFERAVISAVNLAEVGAKMIERGAALELLEAEIRAAEITVVAFDAAQAMESARLRPATKERGLSLGDRACLALAARTDRIVLTSDRDWTEVRLPLDIRLIR
jgi:ribonuclease VapC